MRKIIIVLLILILDITSIIASSLYLGPFNAITNINLNGPADWRTPRDVTAKQGQPIKVNGAGTYYEDTASQAFDDLQIVALGALHEIPHQSLLWEEIYDDAENFGIEISVESSSYDDGYFWFTSQSNPDSRRPFKLQLAVSYRRPGDDDTIDSGIDNQGWVINGELEPTEFYLKNVQYDAAVHRYSIIFDIGIILPSDETSPSKPSIDNGILTVDRKNYIIASADDYSAEISITVELISKNGEVFPEEWDGSPTAITLTLPLSGFYDPTLPAGQDINRFLDMSSSLDIKTTAKATNVDLLMDQNKEFKIADLEYSIYNVNNNNSLYGSSQIADDDIFIFLSASPNPFVQDEDGFMFVHEDADSTQVPSPEERIGYELELRPTIDTGNGLIQKIPEKMSAEFDGTDFINGSNVPENRVGTVCFNEYLGHANEPKGRHWHSYEGEIWLHLDTAEVSPMNAGYYKSYVYVHAVVDDGV